MQFKVMFSLISLKALVANLTTCKSFVANLKNLSSFLVLMGHSDWIWIVIIVKTWTISSLTA